MNKMRRISPMCPKCKRHNTYDIIPELPNAPEIQLSEHELEHLWKKTVGNAKYYCVDCHYTWKKYRGKRPYDRIKVVDVSIGGFPGPYFKVKIDLHALTVYRDIGIGEMEFSNSRTKEEIEWFRSELYKCDFVNWAEDYYALACDGTQWTVRIEYDTYCEIKWGSNHFPPKWTKFRKAVSKISGGEFY
jgi:hypothetical protein